MVESTTSEQAIIPIRLVFSSFDFKYFMPGHCLKRIKIIQGKIMLNKYIPICVATDVESGAWWSFVPQFGQK